jgi:tetratricopeptide (TPR) repeat protein
MQTVKVLFLTAHPTSTNRQAIEEETRAIEQKVRAAEHRDVLILQSHWAVRSDDLLHLLNQHRPQIVHFRGHGSPGELCLVGIDGQVRPVSTRALEALFATLRDNIRLVFLNGCSSQEQALALVTTIDCVVRMKESIYGDAAAVFASSFYRALGFGRSIQEAFEQGRTALLLEGSSEENVPELLVKNGIDPGRIVLIGHRTNPSDGFGLPSIDRQSGPIWNIPFPRNLFFTGRDALLERLHAQWHTMQMGAAGQPQAIIGLGGIGKTQLAIEYAYRYGREYQAVLWARAETTEALHASYIEIAGLLALHHKEAQEQEAIVQAVKDWLRMNQEWLLVLDNVDDLSIVQPFLPTRLAGHVLLTTRAQAIGELAKPLEIETLDEQAGTLLLLRRARLIESEVGEENASPADRAGATRISREFGGLPLALDQAGAYIEETACSPVSYEQRYQAERARLLARRGVGKRSHPEPVATTWSISFQQVEQKNPTAAELLRICAFLAPDAIPEELLVEALKMPLPTPEETGAASDESAKASPISVGQLDEAVALLRAYSLVQRHSQEQTLAVHRLVQVVVRDTMEQEEQVLWITRVIRAVNARFPSAEFGTWNQCARYVLQALICDEWMEQHHLNMPEGASLLHRVGQYLYGRAQYELAEPLYLRALRIKELALGPEHPNTGAALHALASLYHDQGKHELAEPLYLRALHIHEQALGPEHPDTGTALHALARLYHDQGKYESAEPLYLRALHIHEQALGPEHPDTGASLHALALLYHDQGNYELAEPLYLRALRIAELALGPEHPDTGAALHALASLYHDQGKYALAEPLYLRALRIAELALGPEHPDTGAALHALASLYHDQGKYALAEPLYLRALRIAELALGPEHPNTGAALHALARLYHNQGKHELAEPLYLRALHIHEQALGPEHPDTGAALHALARLYRDQGKYALAEPLYLRALHIHEQALGPEHPDTGTSLHALARLYHDQGKYESAEPLYLRALRIAELALGPEHPDTGAALHALASLYHDQGKYALAEPLYLRALRIAELALGPEHPNTGAALHALARLYHNQGKHELAEPLYLRALRIAELALGPEHPDTGAALHALASLYRDQGKYALAEPLYLRALRIKELALGPEHPNTGAALHALARLYHVRGKYELAEPLYLRALRIKELALRPEHPDTGAALHALARLYHARGKYELAEPLYLRALHIHEQALGTEHPDTGAALHALASLYHDQGKYALAEPLYLRALHIHELALGPEHPDTGTSLHALASLYHDQGKHALAEPLYLRALHIKEQVLGPEHPRTQVIRKDYTALLHTLKRTKRPRLKWLRWLYKTTASRTLPQPSHTNPRSERQRFF